MRRLLLLLVLLLPVWAYAQAPLGPNARVSLLTEAPGDQLYSAFGHSALRIADPDLGIDYVFNYGVFDFDAPNFYLNFARGRLMYQLAVYDYELLEASALRSRRPMYEQQLALTPEESGRLLALLMENYRPEYRTYRYHFFEDNCATRLRDMLDRAMPGQIDWRDAQQPVRHTFRQMTDPYIEARMPWADFGIDLGLGLPADRMPTRRLAGYLPDTLAKSFELAVIRDPAAPGGVKPLVRQVVPLVQVAAVPDAPLPVAPIPLMWGLFGVAVAMSGVQVWRQRKGDPVVHAASWLDVILLSLVGVLGVVICLLWFATDHTTTHYNLNVLWALPVLIVFVPLARWGRYRKWLPQALWICAGMAGLTAVLWDIIPQNFHAAAWPLAALVAVRCAMIAWRLQLREAQRRL